MPENRTGDDVVTIETPEHVTFEYELAGMGSRIVAALIDVMLVGLALLLLVLILSVAAGGIGELAPFAVAGTVVAAFALFWGYPICCEIFMQGQTFGKRSLKIRVIREGGYALTPAVVIVRNLMRLVDFLPGFYFLGLVTMILNRRYKRIGDFVAATIVIKEKKEVYVRPKEVSRVISSPENQDAMAEFRRMGVHRLAPDQIRLVEEFLRRHPDLEMESRRRILNQLCTSLSRQLQVKIPRSERYLKLLLAAYRQGEAGATGEKKP